jgi:hypothetical protein
MDDIYVKRLAYKLEERNAFAILGSEESSVLKQTFLKEYKRILL